MLVYDIGLALNLTRSKMVGQLLTKYSQVFIINVADPLVARQRFQH
jgi:hypothetical protein